MEMINTTRIKSSRASKLNLSSVCKLFSSFLIVSACLVSPGLAQFATPLAPAPGSGSIPTPEISGDSLPSPAVVSGQAKTAPLNGTNLPNIINSGRTTVYIYSNCTRGADDVMAGTRLVLTLRPATLMSAQVSDISNILGLNLNSGQAVIHAPATAHQL